jgi:hypothetical protein
MLSLRALALQLQPVLLTSGILRCSTESLELTHCCSYTILRCTSCTHTSTVAAGADVDACDAHGNSVLKFAYAAPPPGAMLRALRAAAQFNTSVNFATATSDAPPPTVAVTRPRRCSIGSSSSTSSKGRKLSGVLKSSSSSSDNDSTMTTATTAAAATASSDSDSNLIASQEQRRVRFSVDLSISGEVGAGGLGALQQRGAWRAR